MKISPVILRLPRQVSASRLVGESFVMPRNMPRKYLPIALQELESIPSVAGEVAMRLE